jgi:multidrug efflux system outer membrane protein
MKPKPDFFKACLALVLICSGCIKLGPDYKRPDTGIQIPTRFHNAPPDASPVRLLDRWWQVFQDPVLNRLVPEALKNNLDIKQAAARVQEVRAVLAQTHADRWPTLGFQGEGKRQKYATIPGIPFYSGQKTTVYTASIPASFELDLWGKLARAEEAAVDDLLAAEESRRTVAQTVAAETVTLYLQIEAFERRIQIAENSIISFRRSLDFVENRYRRGLTSVLDVRQARRVLAQGESNLPSLRQELGIAQQKLAILLGRYPENSPPRTHESDYLKLPQEIPAGLPSELLLRRPDIRTSEASLKAANARVGVAVASRFPSISLTGNLGYSSNELTQLLDQNGQLWSIALGLTQPIFDAGKLKAGQRAAEARYRQAEADYAKTLLNAFSEVEGALLTREEKLKQRERLMVLVNEARATQKVAESRYIRGLENYLTVLDSQQSRYQAEDSLVLVDLSILSNRVTLYRALGGGWEMVYE